MSTVTQGQCELVLDAHGAFRMPPTYEIHVRQAEATLPAVFYFFFKPDVVEVPAALR